jgi:hypothetical protein
VRIVIGIIIGFADVLIIIIIASHHSSLSQFLVGCS